MKCPFLQEECIKKNCGLWTKVVVKDEQPGILGFEEGCAIVLQVRTRERGYILAGRLGQVRTGFFSEESLSYIGAKNENTT